MDIRSLVDQYIAETGLARLVEQDGVFAVLFLDENEVIPLADLAYSSEMGFYRKSVFPAEAGLLTTRQAAERLGLTDDSSVRQAIRRGRLKATRFGRDWMIDPRDLETYRR